MIRYDMVFTIEDFVKTTKAKKDFDPFHKETTIHRTVKLHDGRTATIDYLSTTPLHVVVDEIVSLLGDDKK